MLIGRRRPELGEPDPHRPLVGEERLVVAEEAPLDDEPDTGVRDEAAASLTTARQHEMDARLTLRTAKERHRALHGKAEELRRPARAEREARERAARALAARGGELGHRGRGRDRNRA